MPKRNPQLNLLAKQPMGYGGELLKTRKGRQHGRPLDTKNTMHLVLRSTKAVGEWSFRKKNNYKAINQIIAKFSKKYGVKIISLANVGNHLHFHIKLATRHTYRQFIRAITAAIAMAVTQASRWQTLKKLGIKKFWDYRPYTTVVKACRQYLNLKDYIKINQYEGQGYSRQTARYFVRKGIIPNTT